MGFCFFLNLVTFFGWLSDCILYYQISKRLCFGFVTFAFHPWIYLFIYLVSCFHLCRIPCLFLNYAIHKGERSVYIALQFLKSSFMQCGGFLGDLLTIAFWLYFLNKVLLLENTIYCSFLIPLLCASLLVHGIMLNLCIILNCHCTIDEIEQFFLLKK